MMGSEISDNARAILLLTAPLLAGRGKSSVSPLSAGAYRQLARRLRELQREPADLLGSDTRQILQDCNSVQDTSRLPQLLNRGLVLSLAMERWRSRAIWVMSRADAGYPSRLKQRLKDNAPPVIYGCGDADLLDTGSLAVVGSRNVNDTLVNYTRGVGRLAAKSRCTVISGGARGIDQAAMQGALEAGGRVVGVLGDSLEKAVLRKDYRDALMGGRLVLVCPYDPGARFQVGHAMARNKLIYALSDAALVVNADFEKGGTWAGAVEQLEKLNFVPVYVRNHGETGQGLPALQQRGAQPWPDPETPEAFVGCLRPQQPGEPLPDEAPSAPSLQKLPLDRLNGRGLSAAPGSEHPVVPAGRSTPAVQPALPSVSIPFSREQKLARFLSGDFHQHNVRTLKQLCKANGLTGYSGLRKEKLCQKLLAADVTPPPPPLASLSKTQLVALAEQLLDAVQTTTG